MKRIPGVRTAALLVAGLVVALLSGCAAEMAHQRGMRLIEEGNRAQGMAELEKALQLEPNNARYRIDYRNQVLQDTKVVVARADDALRSGDQAAARAGYVAALRMDPSNESVRRAIAAIDLEQRMRAIVADSERMADAGQVDAALDKLRSTLADYPASQTLSRALAQMQARADKVEAARQAKANLGSVMKRPVTLQFRDANLRMVFEALSRTTGLNVIFDREVRADLKTTIFVRDASVDDTVSLILLQNQLEKKVLNANTLFIYPATAAKQKEYQDLKVRTFQLSNADAKYVQNMLKTVLKVKDIALDERTNTLVIRDTPDAIAVAEKVILAHDLADAEVIIEVQLLEVARDRLINLGIEWPTKAIIATPPSVNTIGALKNMTRDDLTITPLAVGINLKLEDSDANLLASPRIRARDREKARIMIGDKVPVITNTVTPVASGSSVVTGSVQYIDVGIKLEVEPKVYLEGDIGIKLNLEVSNIVKQIGDGSANSTLAYQIGSRNASTTLRLHDGETQVLGGLIGDIDRHTASKVPGLGQLPILGRLFRSDSGTSTKTEIVLSITPRIVRGPGVAENRYRDVYSGSEAAVREVPLRLDPVGAASGATTGPSAPAVPSTSSRSTSPSAPVAAPRAAEPRATSEVSPAPAPRPALLPPPATVEPGTSSGVSPAPTPPPESGPAPGAPTAGEGAEAARREVPATQPAPQSAPAAPAAMPQAKAQPAPATPSRAPPVVATAKDGAPFVASWMGPFRVKVGDEFAVTLRVNSPASLRDLPLEIKFDPQVLTFVDAQPADFATKAGLSAFNATVDAANGVIRIDMRSSGADGFRGQGDLLTLRFTAQTPWKQTQLSIARNDLKSEGSDTAVPFRSMPLTLRVGG